MGQKGYNEVYLQGHSLGCTKTVYSYKRLIENNDQEVLNKIKAVILLSLVDIPMAIKFFFPGDAQKLTLYMEDEKRKGNGQNLYFAEGALIPMCPNTFLSFVKDNKIIDFARYNDEKFEYPELNQIKVPLFMRWGNNNELIMQDADRLINMLNDKIKNVNKNINYIDGAGHNYRGYEEQLFKEMLEFISNTVK